MGPLRSVVANAEKPSALSARADPTSQGLGITRGRARAVQGQEVLRSRWAHETSPLRSAAGSHAREATASMFQALIVTIRASKAPISSGVRWAATSS